MSEVGDVKRIDDRSIAHCPVTLLGVLVQQESDVDVALVGRISLNDGIGGRNMIAAIDIRIVGRVIADGEETAREPDVAFRQIVESEDAVFLQHVLLPGLFLGQGIERRNAITANQHGISDSSSVVAIVGHHCLVILELKHGTLHVTESLVACDVVDTSHGWIDHRTSVHIQNHSTRSLMDCKWRLHSVHRLLIATDASREQ